MDIEITVDTNTYMAYGNAPLATINSNSYSTTPPMWQFTSLAPLQDCAPCAPVTKCGKSKAIKPYCDEKKDTTMNIEREKMQYLNERMYLLEDKISNKLLRKFGLLDDEAPRNGKEMLARITAGKYILDEKNMKSYYGATSGIKWRDPSITEDQAGYEAAKATVETASTAVRDAINVLPADQALKMLQDFETAHLTAN